MRGVRNDGQKRNKRRLQNNQKPLGQMPDSPEASKVRKR